jgi:DNA repair photolyase
MKNEKKNTPFGTKEWCKTNLNFINGCYNDCKYCYAKAMAIRFGRKQPDNWSEEEIKTHKLNQVIRRRDGRIMLPSSHDITPVHIADSLSFIHRVLEVENDILIVTKPHLDVIEQICTEFKDFKDQILFRFTIGSVDNKILKFWEPNAPSFEERFAALFHAFHLDFETSVSIEPALDIRTLELVSQVLPLTTDSIWIGKPNKLVMRLKQNGHHDDETIKKARSLIESQNSDWADSLYKEFASNPKVKWKDSMKKVLGIEQPNDDGLDI